MSDKTVSKPLSEAERKARFQELLEAASEQTGFRVVAVMTSKNYGEGGVALEPIVILQKIEGWVNVDAAAD